MSGAVSVVADVDTLRCWLSELRFRRLKWLRTMVKHYQDHIAAITALTGELNCGGPAELDELGQLVQGKDSNPWLRGCL